MNRSLDVYLHNNFVGNLTQDDAGNLAFAYDVAYSGHAISISMPCDSSTGHYAGKTVKAFFSGLLPEESVRERLAKYLGLSEQNAFALLEHIGGDCAGALSLYPQGHKPEQESEDIEILDDARLKEILAVIKRRPMLVADGYRLSLAGAQDKLAVGFKDDRICLMRGGSPTTHILKPMIEWIKDSTHNEVFCMQLAQRIGIDAPQATVHLVDDTPYYLVERYDRIVADDGQVQRIHQEDFCQALGIAPEMKYQREGGPSIAACQEVIVNHTDHPAANQIKFLNIIIFNYLIGNADAHGKNFSLLYKSNRPELAPAYDLLSTAVYPDLDKKMAMKIGSKYKPKEVYLRHFHSLVADTKTAQSALNKQIQTMTGKIVDTAHALKTEFEPIHSNVFAEIIKNIEINVERLSI